MSAPTAEPRSSLSAGQPAATLTHPRSRRALLAGLAGGAGALVATALGRVPVVRGVVANPMLLGTTNDAGSATTRLDSASGGANSSFWVANSESGTAIKGVAVRGNGGQFRTSVNNKFGLIGVNAAATAGSGAAVQAAGKHNTAVLATTDEPSRYAIDATNTDTTIPNTAVTGLAYNAASGDTHPAGAQSFYQAAGEFAGINGVIGASIPSATNGTGVVGVSPGTAGYGVYGYAPAASGSTYGVYGRSDSTSGYGVFGTGPGGTSGVGVRGAGNPGVYGVSAGSGTAVIGSVTGTNVSGWGVFGYASAGFAIYGNSDTGYAVYSDGDCSVTGTLSKAGGSFKIDHPLDPAHKYLYHSFVESPDMMNVYNGVVTADAKGEATVSLPDWFSALNQDFRYQLTPIGSAMPDLHVSAEVADNRFAVAGAAPHAKVSWQLTGIRHDAWAEAHRVEVEVTKSGDEAGKYLHPAEHGQPASAGVEYERQRRAAAMGAGG